MLQRIERNITTEGRALSAASHFTKEQSNDEILTLLQCLRRNLRQIGWATLLGLAVSILALATITPLFKATATVLVDPRKPQILKDREIQSDRSLLSGAGAQNAAIDSEVEILGSPALARQVVEKLDLQNDEEFAPDLFSRVMAGLTGPILRMLGIERENVDPLAPHVKALIEKIGASRQQLTYVIKLDMWSKDSRKAAKIANTFTQLYIANQVAVKKSAGHEMADWMNDRASQLRHALNKSESAYEAYKSKEGLFDPGGEILSNQQIQQLNQQLVQARAQAASAKAKYEQLDRITPDKLNSMAAAPDVLQSAVIKQLRAQYADVAKQHADFKSRYGLKHPLLVSTAAQLSDVSDLITAEISRIVASAKLEYEMARSSQQSLEASLDDLKEKAVQANEASIRLRELDADVQANKDVYQAFLARAKEATAQIEMQTPDSRVIAAATPPIDIDFPKKSLVLAMGLFGGLVAGIGFAIARDAFGGGFRHAEDLETSFGIHPLAQIPLATAGTCRIPLLRHSGGDGHSHYLVRWENRHNRRTRALANLVVDRPDCPFSESIQSLRYALQRAIGLHGVRTVLVTSALPNEGKTTVILNLARASAAEGVRTLLIDADMRDPSIATALGVPDTYGLEDYLAGRRRLTSDISRDRQTDLFAISSNQPMDGPRALKLLASHQMSELLSLARDMFDLVLIDAPPLLPVADARVLADKVDGVMLVVAAAQTRREALSAAIHEVPGIEDKLIGIALNKIANDFKRYYGRAAG